jgi:chromosome segregation ATPase
MANAQLTTRVTDILSMLQTMQGNITTLRADMGRRFDTLRDHVDRQLNALTATNNQSNQLLHATQQDLTNANNGLATANTNLGQLATVSTQLRERLDTANTNLDRLSADSHHA